MSPLPYRSDPSATKALRSTNVFKPKRAKVGGLAPGELVHLVRENLRLLAEFSTRYEVGQVVVKSRDKTIDSPESVAAYLSPEMAPLEQEQLRVVMLDVKNHLLGVHLVYQGGVNQAVVSLADVFREAIRVGASAVILAHNQGGGAMFAAKSPQGSIRQHLIS